MYVLFFRLVTVSPRKKVDFFVAPPICIRKQTRMWSALFCRPHQGWFRNRDNYTWPFRGLQILPRNCFQRITLNSVLCEALGDRISGDSSGINFMARLDSSQSRKESVLRDILAIIRVFISTGGGPQTLDTSAINPFCSKKNISIAKSMNTLRKHFNVYRLWCMAAFRIVLHFGSRRSLDTNGNFLRSILSLTLTQLSLEFIGCTKKARAGRRNDPHHVVDWFGKCET